MFREAFNKTLNRYGLTAKKLSEKSGVSENHISAFRRGVSEIGSKKLEALIEAMDEIAPGSKEYFCSQMAGSSLKPGDLRSLVEQSDVQELSQLLHLVAEQLKNGKSTEAFRVMAKI